MFSVVLAAILLAAPAGADDAQRGQLVAEHLSRAERLLREGDYRNALWNFQQANLQRSSPSATLGMAECLEKIGDKALAAYYYRVYLRVAPNARDRLEVAERVGEVLYAELINGRALLELESPVPARGSIDGRNYNAFPIALFLPPGDHELTVEFPTGSEKRTVSLHRGRTMSLALEPPSPPQLAVATLPAPAGGDGTVATAMSTTAIPGRDSTPGSALPTAPVSGRDATPVAAFPAASAPAAQSRLRPPPESTRGWVAIAHPGGSSTMSLSRLRDIFSGERLVTEGGQVAEIVLPHEGNPARDAFLSQVLHKSEASLRASWRKLVFRGGGVRPPIQVDTDEEVVRVVRARQGVVGIVADGIETSGVTRVTIR